MQVVSLCYLIVLIQSNVGQKINIYYRIEINKKIYYTMAMINVFKSNFQFNLILHLTKKMQCIQNNLPSSSIVWLQYLNT